jgi:WD40 repeat protein
MPILAAGDANGFIKLWDLGHEEVAQVVQEKPPGIIAKVSTSTARVKSLSMASNLLAAPSMDIGDLGPSEVGIWELPTLTAVRRMPIKEPQMELPVTFGISPAVALAPDASLVAGHSFRELMVWKVNGTRTRKSPVNVRCLAFNITGDVVAAGGLSGEVTLWPQGGDQLKPLPALEKLWLNSVKFSVTTDTENILASGGESGVATIWDWRKGASLHDLKHPGPVLSVAFSPDGKFLATGTGDPDNMVRVWSLSDGTEVTLEAIKKHPGKVTSVAFSGAKTVGENLAFSLASCSGNTIRVWDFGPKFVLLRNPIELNNTKPGEPGVAVPVLVVDFWRKAPAKLTQPTLRN